MRKKESICAVIVTYNRKEFLLRCLNAIMDQVYPVDSIIVIDNASTDGTMDFLHKNNWQSNHKFEVIGLSENSGGAGGFYTGIKYAYEKGFDYIWLMDDDGFPDKNCLERLIPYISEYTYIGPIVLDSQNKNKLSFALRLPNSLDVLDYYSDLNEILKSTMVKDIVLPFNGTLISRQLVEKIGFPHKEYFIWGDEKEYTLRALKEKANVATITHSIFYHPSESSSSTPMFFNKLRFNNSPSDLKLYCFCRNSVAIYLKHYSIIYSLLFLCKTTWFFSFTRPSWKKLKLCWRAMYHGFRKDFSHHKEYLK